MRSYYLFGLILISLILISGCFNNNRTDLVCNKPYILVGAECCLDQNDNLICDKDENLKEDAIKEGDHISYYSTDNSEIYVNVCLNKINEASNQQYDECDLTGVEEINDDYLKSLGYKAKITCYCLEK